jgi:excisionase family DNA binding protein
MSSDQPESLLTVAEVAEWLKLNQQTIRNWIDAGDLPAVRVGRAVRIKRSDLDRKVADGYQGASQAARAEAGPSADDFWSGEPVGMAEPDPQATPAATELLAARTRAETEEEASEE